jgi:hypothetical protein
MRRVDVIYFMDSNDIRMVKSRDGTGFLGESKHTTFIGSQFIR